MNKFIMLVGLPGSGKSTFAKNLGYKIFSSDELRKELWGDESIQGNNTELFTELHRRIKEALKNGEDCVYDATNINAKRRTAFLNEIKKIKCEKICAVIITDFDLCLERNSQRDRKVPYEVIKKMYLTFDVPQFREGWDDIWISVNKKGGKSYDITKLVDHLSQIPHDNPHHVLTIGDHIIATTNRIREKYSLSFAGDIERLNVLSVAAFFHDIGKEFCKTFQNSKGELDNVAHYYRHENVSAYMFILYSEGMFENSKDILYVADLIGLHMRLFVPEESEEKVSNKLKQLIGERKFEDLCILHRADIECEGGYEGEQKIFGAFRRDR